MKHPDMKDSSHHQRNMDKWDDIICWGGISQADFSHLARLPNFHWTRQRSSSVCNPTSFRDGLFSGALRKSPVQITGLLQGASKKVAGMRASTLFPLEITHFRTHPSTQILGWRPLPLRVANFTSQVSYWASIVSKYFPDRADLPWKPTTQTADLKQSSTPVVQHNTPKVCLTKALLRRIFLPNHLQRIPFAMCHFNYHLGNTSLSKKKRPLSKPRFSGATSNAYGSPDRHRWHSDHLQSAQWYLNRNQLKDLEDLKPIP